MDEERSRRTPARRAVGGDLIIPIAAVAFALYYFATIFGSPWEAQVNAFFVGTILIVLVAIFLARLTSAIVRGEADLRLSGVIEPRAIAPKRLILLLLAVGYMTVIGWLGFTITTFVFLAVAMLVLNDGRRAGLVLGLAATLALGGYLLFIVAFQTRFPIGPFERLMGSVL